MTTQAMGPMAGFEWLKNAINLGRNNPKAVFGGAALLLASVLAVAFVAGLLQVALTAAMGPGMITMTIGMLVLMALVMGVLSVLMVGYLRLIDADESGRSARAFEVFAGFGDLATSLRTFGFVVLLAIVQNLLLFGLLAVFAGGVVDWYMQVMEASAGGAAPAITALPDGFGIAGLVMALVGVVFFAIQAIGLCQIALRGRGVAGALGDGIVGAFKNLLPLLVFTAACIVAMVVAGIVLFLLALLVGVMAKLAGAWLAVVLGIPLYLLVLLGVYVVMFGAMYHLWRDVCGSDGVIEAPAEALVV